MGGDAHILRGAAYPYDLLERTWQRVLLGQFHDILPGSSIAWVHRDAEQAYAEVAEVLHRVLATALASLAGDGAERLAFNAAPHVRVGARRGDRLRRRRHQRRDLRP